MCFFSTKQQILKKTNSATFTANAAKGAVESKFKKESQPQLYITKEGDEEKNGKKMKRKNFPKISFCQEHIRRKQRVRLNFMSRVKWLLSLTPSKITAV